MPENQLEALLTRLWSRDTADGARVAGQVREGISQQVGALRIGLAALHHRASQDGLSEGFSREIENLQSVAGRLTASVAELVDELPAAVLLRPSAVLRSKVDRAGRELGIPIRCRLADVNLTPAFSALLFQVLAEGLLNVARHARANSVDISLEETGGVVRFSLADDGCGFDSGNGAMKTLGLFELRTRARLTGAELTVASHPGRGTRLDLSFRAGLAASLAMGINVLVADDHPVVRQGLCDVLARAGMGTEEVGSFPALRDYLTKRLPDVLLMDINMPGGNGLEMVGELRRSYPHLPVLVVSVHREEQAGVRALRFGAKGYLTKDASPETLIAAVRKLHGGGRHVSPALSEALAEHVGRGEREPHHALSGRELTVLGCIASGRNTAEIALQMNISPKTVATYRARIGEKMGMKSVAELTRYVIEKGLCA